MYMSWLCSGLSISKQAWQRASVLDTGDSNCWILILKESNQTIFCHETWLNCVTTPLSNFGKM
jgi:hypothetical protein